MFDISLPALASPLPPLLSHLPLSLPMPFLILPLLHHPITHPPLLFRFPFPSGDIEPVEWFSAELRSSLTALFNILAPVLRRQWVDRQTDRPCTSGSSSKEALLIQLGPHHGRMPSTHVCVQAPSPDCFDQCFWRLGWLWFWQPPW